jgi:hypothetical protein
MQVVLLADWMGFARHLNLSRRVISSRRPRCRAVTAVDLRTQRDPFELTQKMIVGTALVRKHWRDSDPVLGDQLAELIEDLNYELARAIVDGGESFQGLQGITSQPPT